MRRACVLALMIPPLLVGAAQADPALDVLVASYPDHLAGYDARDLIWKDGTRMPLSDGRAKSFEEMLEAPDINEQFAIPYPLGPISAPPARNQDPGRIRNEAFFRKMYGDCRKGEVTARLRPLVWMSGHAGRTVMVTSINGVADKLAEVARSLATLPAGMMKYLVPSAGTYNCRAIANTTRLSVHAFGAAIDINTRFSDYWEWAKNKNALVWKNRIPNEIAQVFERHGFIWGAKWYHFDTMHFEYRPELVALAKQGWPAR